MKRNRSHPDVAAPAWDASLPSDVSLALAQLRALWDVGADALSAVPAFTVAALRGTLGAAGAGFGAELSALVASGAP